MYGQDVLDAADLLDRAVSDLAQCRKYGSVIVVFVADVGIIIHLDHHLEDGDIVERETGGVISIAIDAVPIEISVIVNEEVFNALIVVGVDVCFFVDKTAMNIDMIKILHTLVIFFLDGFKHRHHDSDFEFVSVQCFRKCIDNVRQAACLDKRQ